MSIGTWSQRDTVALMLQTEQLVKGTMFKDQSKGQEVENLGACNSCELMLRGVSSEHC